MKFTEADSRLLEVCIQELEVRTCAEVVFVLRESSGNYRDVSHLCGASAGWVALLFAMSVPAQIPEHWLPLPMAFIFWIVSYGVTHSRFRVWLATAARKKGQVSKAAHACFYEKKIHQTSSHSGILVYCSLFEKRVEIIMDRTAEKAVDLAKIEEFKVKITSHFGQLPAETLRGLLEVLRSFGVYLGTQLPPSLGEKLNELENLPDLNSGEQE